MEITRVSARTITEARQNKRKILAADIVREVRRQDIRDIIRMLITKAVDGDVPAAREILDRVVGKPKVTMDLESGVDRPGDRLWAVISASPEMIESLGKLAMQAIADKAPAASDGDGDKVGGDSESE